MKILRGMNGTARLKHQDFHSGLRQLHCRPSAAGAGSNNYCIVSGAHVFYRKAKLDQVMFRVLTPWENRVVGITPVVKCLNHPLARSVEGKRILSFDEPVGEEGWVMRGRIALGLRHRRNQSFSRFATGRVKSRRLQCGEGAPPQFLRCRFIIAKDLQEEIDEMRAIRFACTGSVVAGNQDLRKSLQRLEILRCKELRLIVAQRRRLGRRRGVTSMTMLRSGFAPLREKGNSGRCGSRTKS